MKMPFANRWTALSGREQALIAAAALLALGLAAIMGGLRPGLEADRSAGDRHRRSTLELADIRRLSHETDGQRAIIAATSIDAAMARIDETSSLHGVTVLQKRNDDGVLAVQASGPTSSALINWIADCSGASALGVRSLSIRRGDSGGLLADVAFSRGQS